MLNLIDESLGSYTNWLAAVKAYSAAAERNKHAILAVLRNEVSDKDLVFEFGSGTGQHTCHFASHLPNVTWQPSELADKLPGIRQWIAESECTNILPPLELDLQPERQADMIASHCYSANTLHIVSWPLVKRLFQQSATILSTGGKLCIYGPFKFDNKHTSDGNDQFDQQLRRTDPKSGIRDVSDLDRLANQHGFTSARIINMPANNNLLIWDLCV